MALSHTQESGMSLEGRGGWKQKVGFLEHPVQNGGPSLLEAMAASADSTWLAFGTLSIRCLRTLLSGKGGDGNIDSGPYPQALSSAICMCCPTIFGQSLHTPRAGHHAEHVVEP